MAVLNVFSCSYINFLGSAKKYCVWSPFLEFVCLFITSSQYRTILFYSNLIYTNLYRNYLHVMLNNYLISLGWSFTSPSVNVADIIWVEEITHFDLWWFTDIQFPVSVMCSYNNFITDIAKFHFCNSKLIYRKGQSSMTGIYFAKNFSFWHFQISGFRKLQLVKSRQY